MTNTTSSLMAAEPVVDLAIAAAMADELEDYIIKDDVYRTVIARTPAGDQNVQMSGGDLLARLHRLLGQRETLSAEQRQKLDGVQTKVETVIHSLRSRFLEILQREMKARLDSLRWFLDDCNEDRKRCRTEFPYEIRNRQRIEEILKQFTNRSVDEDLLAQLKKVDRRIRQNTEGCPFIWDVRLQSVFPPDPYWYLYVKP